MKEALTRKFGPLPAWAWFLGLFAVVYYYRKYKGQMTSSSTATGTASDTSTSAKQDPVVLQPGESVYDPNTGQLYGGGGSSGDSGSGSGGGSGGDTGTGTDTGNPQNTTTSTDSGGTVPGTVPSDTAAAPAFSPATSSAHRKRVGSKAGPHGAIVAPYGARKPPNKKGYRTVGTGKGGWIYVPVKAKAGGHRSAQSRPQKLSGVRKAGSKLKGLRSLGKPRTAAHTQDARSKKGFSPTRGARPRVAPQHQAAHKTVRSSATPVRNRTGLQRPMTHRTENQRPAAVQRKVGQPAVAQAPAPSRAVASSNPGRTVNVGGGPPRERPREPAKRGRRR